MRRLLHIFIAAFTASFALASGADVNDFGVDLDPQANNVLSEAPHQ